MVTAYQQLDATISVWQRRIGANNNMQSRLLKACIKEFDDLRSRLIDHHIQNDMQSAKKCETELSAKWGELREAARAVNRAQRLTALPGLNF